MKADRRAGKIALGAVLATALVAGCGGGGDAGAFNVSVGTTVAGVAAAPETSSVETAVIRLALPPDPVWEWLEDSGARAAWEAAHNVRIEVTNPFDQFAAFVGGHADIVLLNAFDVSKFADQAERQPVIIGKYTVDRSILAVRRNSRAETLEDLLEKRIAVESSLTSIPLWALIAETRYGLEFGPDSPDFELVPVEPTGVADLVVRGDVDACICSLDFSARLLASERMWALYDGASASELFAAVVFGGQGAGGIIAGAFVTDRSWYDANPQAAAAFLALWEEGLTAWRQNKSQIVADYPHHFSVETTAEIEWLADYLEAHNWVAPSVYITDRQADTHTAAVMSLRNRGFLPAEAVAPDIEVIPAPTGGEPGGSP